MKYSCDTLILGSGISGMTLGLLFAAASQRVLMLERACTPGGAMQRFYRNGIGLDTGFHFTGGISDSFGNMLRILELDQLIETVPIRQKVHFSDSRNTYDMPAGLPALEQELCRKFPDQSTGIHAFFQAERKVFAQTPLFHLQGPEAFFNDLPDLEEDHITLQAFLDQHHIHGELYALLCGYCSCHGTPPQEISFANHARIHYGLSHDPVRLKSGGQALVNAFLQKAKEKGITLLNGTTVESWGGADEKSHIRTAILTDGSQVEFKEVIFTQHPSVVLSMLPQDKVRNSFREKTEALEDSCGFFTWYAKLDSDPELPFEEMLYSVLSSADLNSILLGNSPSQRSTGYILANETARDGSVVRCITGFQTEFSSETAAWQNSRSLQRPPSYQTYKQHKTELLKEQFLEMFPCYRGKLQTLNTSSSLTFRDYLFSSGSAYGVRQKVDQINLFGRLPVRNFYIGGQSAILPGAVGSMLTSLILFRKLAGEECYRELLWKKLGNRAP